MTTASRPECRVRADPIPKSAWHCTAYTRVPFHTFVGRAKICLALSTLTLARDRSETLHFAREHCADG